MSQVNQRLSELQIFINSHPHDSTINNTDLLNLLNRHQKNTQIYSQKVKNFWRQIEQNKFSANATKPDQEQLLVFFKEETKISVEFEKLSDELIRIIGHAEIQQKQANVSFDGAQKLRIKVIIGSMLV
ncbi:hypothetical protein [Nostoc sp.]|uniref:hypothetical protein n=1 Tax=Nostoc sp. TaxID=1180 RepID=UPI002FFBADB5